ncbi:MAG: hypothetical protein DRO12_00225 [Thermoprotei archaeon]|nr:MAG: hypothetical protein DRO12_00225 [Thermoprotei archaeon]
MKVINTEEILKRDNYNYLYFEESPSEPETVDMTFADILPQLTKGDERCRYLAKQRMYKHQLEVFKNLAQGKNVVLVSGTGSGKTESWAMYVLKNKIRTLAIYPTLALTDDQFQRLKSYLNAVSGELKVMRIDSTYVRDLMNRYGPAKARYVLAKDVLSTLILLTNPAFLLADLKRLITHGSSWLSEFLREVRLIVVDELDFYGSSRASLLIAMLELLAEITHKPQIVVLGATVGGVDNLKKHLDRVTGRETVVIRGKAFRVRNRWYIVLGRNLYNLWRLAKTLVRENPKLSYLQPLASSFDEFKKYFSLVVEELRSAGYRIEEPYPEYEKILARYVIGEEDGVTIVFCPSIRSAERLAARVGMLIPSEYRDKVAVHHHLVPKDVRTRIEEGLRRNTIKVVFTVRTLLQGIDIGTVVRVIHYGLPRDIRELRQREGRKGRRREIPFTESIVLPLFPWDRELVSLGLDALKEWLSQEVEGVYINPENDYVKLFKALVKYFTRQELEDKELELLKALGLIEFQRSLYGERLVLSSEGRRVWFYINFYEFGPPYGVPRFIKKDDEVKPLEEVSRRDFVEKFQLYNFDVGNEAIVLKADPRRGIVEKPLSEALREPDEVLAEVSRHYALIKLRWGEKADLRSDVLSGRLQSLVVISVRTPEKGFGFFLEEPLYVKWLVESSRPRPVKIGDRIVVTYRRESIEVPAPCIGSYKGLTYGFTIELPPRVKVEEAKVAAAALQVTLRLSDYKIPLREVEFVVQEQVKSRPILLVWEPEPAGILTSIDWNKIRDSVDKLGSSPIHFVLLKAVDDIAAMYFADVLRGDWKKVKELANELLDHVVFKIHGVIPSLKPLLQGKDKVISLYVEQISFRGMNYWCLSSYGSAPVALKESALCASFESTPCTEVIKGLKEILDYTYRTSNVLLVHFGQLSMLQTIASEDRTAALLFDVLRNEGRIIDLYPLVVKIYRRDVSLGDVVEIVAKFTHSKRRPLIPRCRESERRCGDEIKRVCSYIARTLYILATGRVT